MFAKAIAITVPRYEAKGGVLEVSILEGLGMLFVEGVVRGV